MMQGAVLSGWSTWPLHQRLPASESLQASSGELYGDLASRQTRPVFLPFNIEAWRSEKQRQ